MTEPAPAPAPTAAPRAARRKGLGVLGAVVVFALGLIIGIVAAPTAKTPSSCKNALSTADSMFGRLGGDLTAGRLSTSTLTYLQGATGDYRSDRDACLAH